MSTKIGCTIISSIRQINALVESSYGSLSDLQTPIQSKVWLVDRVLVLELLASRLMPHEYSHTLENIVHTDTSGIGNQMYHILITVFTFHMQ